MTRFGCVVLTPGRAPGRPALGARLAARQRGRGDRRRRGRQRLAARRPARRRARRRTCPRTSGIPAGRNAGVPHVARRAAVLPRRRRQRCVDADALARVAARFAAGPGSALLQLRVDAARRRRAAARLGAAPARRRPRALERRDRASGRARWPCRRRVFEQVGGWPAEFRFVHEGVDLAWRVHGRRLPRASTPATSSRCTPADAVAGRHGYSLYYGARNRVWLARRHLPLPLGVLFVATSPRARCRATCVAPRAAAGAARLPRRLAGPVRPAAAAARPHDLAHDPRRPPARSCERTSLSRTVDEHAPAQADPPRQPRRTSSARERHVYEPHRVGLPPLRPYVRELWRRREFAFELARTKLRAQHFDTAFGQLWLVLNPLLLGGVYFLLVDILRRGSQRAGLLRAPAGRASSPTTSCPTRSATGVEVRRQGRQADPQHRLPARAAAARRR